MIGEYKRFTGRKLHLLGIVSVFLVFAMFAGIFIFAFKQDVTKTAFAGNYTASDVIEMVNQQRVKNNLPALKTNPKLMEASRNKVEDMVANSYFAHISPIDGKKWSTFIRNSGYDYIEAGENLANGFDNTPDLVNAWMNSPTHRDNILNPNVDETGLAVKSGYLDGYPTIFVAQSFGKLDVPALTSEKNTSSKSNTTPAKNVAPETQKTSEKKTEAKKVETPVKSAPLKIDKAKKVGEGLNWEDQVKFQNQDLFK